MKKAAIIICLISLIFSSCGQVKKNETAVKDKSPSASEPAAVTGQPEKTAGTEKIEAFTGDAEIVESLSDAQINVDAAFEGQVKFETEASSASLEYDPDSNEEQKLTLNAADGAVWNLVIPAHSLVEYTTIKMTALKNIESSSLGSLKYGVLLEPDGLQFLKPAKITMSGNEIGDNPVLLGGSHDGSRLELEMAEKAEGGVSASILHFSTVYGDPLDDDKKLGQVRDHALKEYQEIKKLALEYLKKPIQVPAPPAISLRCPADHEKQSSDSLQKFMLLFTHPESSIAQELNSAGRTLTLLTGDWEVMNEAIDITKQLAFRLIKKVDKLYKAYYPQEEYWKAVSYAAAYAGREYMLLGGEKDINYLIEDMHDWGKKIADKFLDELREKHDYKLVKPIITLCRTSVVFVVGWNNIDNYKDELQAALQFEVQYEAEVTLNGSGSVKYQTSGKAPFTMHLAPQFEKYYAKGQGKYDGFSSPEPELTLNLPNSYKFETTIENFDPCLEPPFDVYIDKLGAKNETMIVRGAQVPTQGVVQSTIGLLFKDDMKYDLKEREGTMFYKFSLPFQNLNENAGEKTFTKSFNGVDIKLTVRLIHTPK